jgi:hypothetical protein
MLFIDGVILFGDGIVKKWRDFKHETLFLATRMKTNENKYIILFNKLSLEVKG